MLSLICSIILFISLLIGLYIINTPVFVGFILGIVFTIGFVFVLNWVANRDTDSVKDIYSPSNATYYQQFEEDEDYEEDDH